MSEAMNVDVAENLVLHYLAETEEKKAPREIQHDLDVNMIMITRALRGAKNRKPALVSLENGKYRFVGNKDVLEPLPEDLKIKFGFGGKAEKGTSKKSVDSNAGELAQGLGPIDHQILELLSSRKLLPQSGLMKQFSLAEDEAESILSELENKGLIVGKLLEEFDENAFSLTESGRSVAEAILSGEYAPEQEAAETPVVEEKSTQKKADTTDKEQEPMVATGRKFTLPNFDEIPEENAFGRGRPTGDRDFEQLRVFILGYINDKGSAAKSNISRTLAKQLSTFGRTTIVEEVDKLIEKGLVEGAIVGKRELFSLTPKGEDIIEEVIAGRAIGPIDKKGAKSSAQATKKAAPAAKKAEAPKQAKPAAAQKAKEVAQPVQKAATEAPKKASASVSPAPAPSPAASAPVPASAGSEAHEISEIQANIQQILSQMSGEESFELRQHFFELNAQIRELTKSRNELSELCQSLITKI